MDGAATVSPTAGTLLGLLAERPMTGWELVAAAKERVGNFWTIQRSQAYRELAHLEASGLIRALPEQERRRRPYEIADAGREAYLAWVQQSPGVESVRVPFLLTVAFADDISAERFGSILADQRRQHVERLAEHERSRALLKGDVRGSARVATVELGIAYEQAALDWLDRLPGLLGRQG